MIFHHIGFTGTQKGMTLNQKRAFVELIRAFDAKTGIYFHHGCCVGADAEAHGLVLKIVGKDCIVLHPPKNSAKEAACEGFGQRRERKDYLDRNHDIVDECTLLIAAPEELKEERRSGTWATVRYARKKEVPVIVLDP